MTYVYYGPCDVCQRRRATRKGHFFGGIETYYCAICAGEKEEDEVEEPA